MLYNNLEAVPGSFRRFELSAELAPVGERRALIEARKLELERGLSSSDPATVRRAVGLTRAVMAVAAVDDETRQLQRQAFLSTLTKFPGWAVEEACQRFIDAREGDGIHAPKPGEIARVCRALIASSLEEHGRIRSVLEAEVYTPASKEQREAQAKMLAELMSELVGSDRESENERLMREARLSASEASRKAERAL